MNSERLLANQQTYFSGSYKGFCEFGGPCVYFHHECIRAGHEAFLSERHIEMLLRHADSVGHAPDGRHGEDENETDRMESL